MAFERDLALEIDPGLELPMFLQIARGITSAIREGRLRPGDALPGTRSLSSHLGVHRNTVVSAWAELRAEGWIEARGGGRTSVRRELPESSEKPTGRYPREPSFELRNIDSYVGGAAPVLPPQIPGMLDLSAGSPDVRLIPADALAMAYRRAIRKRGGRALSYGDPRGSEGLRVALARLLGTRRGIAAGPENVLVTRGSQHALDLAARALISPGDRVAVEAYGYPPAWAALRLAGADLVPLPVDRDGVVPDALEEGDFRAIYLTPHHQYPTTVTLSAARRVRILEIARRRECAVIEDDYDHEFHFEGRPVLPLAHLDPGPVVYVGTLSKVLAPGLRLGFAVAPEPVIARMALHRAISDRQGDHAMEAAMEELIADGELERHVRKMRRLYRDRRDALVGFLRRDFGDAIQFEIPTGGIGMWARVDRAIDCDRWQERGVRCGVRFRIGRQFRLDGAPEPAIRLNFAALDEHELAEGVHRMRGALNSLQSG